MASIDKYSTGIVGVIKHNIREFSDGKCPTNQEVDPSKKNMNYSIIKRGETAKEIEKYRKQVMKEVFHYKRKNIVLCNEVICTLPADCPKEQENLFFEESYKYVVSTIPMGEKAVILAVVHRDEGKIMKDGVTVVEGAPHLHVMYIPAVKDSKHENFDFRLCSDELTKRAILKQWHPNYQKWLDDAGVNATVASGVTSGKGISVKTLKEITKETGLSLEQIKNLDKENQKLHQKLAEKEQEITVSSTTISKQESIIMDLQNAAEFHKKELTELHEQIREKDASLSAEKAKIEEVEKTSKDIISDKEKQLEILNEKLAEKDRELSQANNKILELEEEQKKLQLEKEQEHTWGDNTWGTSQNWGTQTTSIEEEKLW